MCVSKKVSCEWKQNRRKGRGDLRFTTLDIADISMCSIRHGFGFLVAQWRAANLSSVVENVRLDDRERSLASEYSREFVDDDESRVARMNERSGWVVYNIPSQFAHSVIFG